MKVREEEQHRDDAQRHDSSDEPEAGAAVALLSPRHSRRLIAFIGSYIIIMQPSLGRTKQ